MVELKNKKYGFKMINARRIQERETGKEVHLQETNN